MILPNFIKFNVEKNIRQYFAVLRQINPLRRCRQQELKILRMPDNTLDRQRAKYSGGRDRVLCDGKSVFNLQSTTPFELSDFLVYLDFRPIEAKSILTARKRNLFRDSSLNNIEF